MSRSDAGPANGGRGRRRHPALDVTVVLCDPSLRLLAMLERSTTQLFSLADR